AAGLDFDLHRLGRVADGIAALRTHLDRAVLVRHALNAARAGRQQNLLGRDNRRLGELVDWLAIGERASETLENLWAIGRRCGPGANEARVERIGKTNGRTHNQRNKAHRSADGVTAALNHDPLLPCSARRGWPRSPRNLLRTILQELGRRQHPLKRSTASQSVTIPKKSHA